MTAFVTVLAVVLLVLGLVVLVAPYRMRWAIETLVRPATLPLLALFRIGFGIALVIAAADTRLPLFVWAFGLLLIVAGVSLPILGIRRLMAMAERWKEASDRVLRGWSLLALLLGALLLWAAW